MPQSRFEKAFCPRCHHVAGILQPISTSAARDQCFRCERCLYFWTQEPAHSPSTSLGGARSMSSRAAAVELPRCPECASVFATLLIGCPGQAMNMYRCV